MNRSFNLVLTILSFLLCFTSVHHADAKDIGWGIPKGENHEQHGQDKNLMILFVRMMLTISVLKMK